MRSIIFPANKDHVRSAANLGAHAESELSFPYLEAFGVTAPILVDETMTILCGHGRWEAAKKLKLPSITVRVASHLTDAKSVR